MVKHMLAGMGCAISLLLTTTVSANEEEEQPAMDFLEFLGEGQTIDGNYHDPMQMQDWQQSELAEGQEEKSDE